MFIIKSTMANIFGMSTTMIAIMADTFQWEANPYVFVYEFERVEKPEAMGC